MPSEHSHVTRGSTEHVQAQHAASSRTTIEHPVRGVDRPSGIPAPDAPTSPADNGTSTFTKAGGRTPL